MVSYLTLVFSNITFIQMENNLHGVSHDYNDTSALATAFIPGKVINKALKIEQQDDEIKYSEKKRRVSNQKKY